MKMNLLRITKTNERRRLIIKNTPKPPLYFTFLQMKLQRTDLLHLTESLKVLQKEREGDREIISKQQEIIENYAKNLKED